MTEITSRSSLDRLSVVAIAISTLTLACGFLLLSAAESLTLVDGAVDWQAESPLRAVVQLLCLDYRWPTMHAGDVKGLILGAGAAVMLISLGVAIISRTRNPFEIRSVSTSPAEYPVSVVEQHRRFPPVVVAQVLALLFLLWSFASVRWSRAADLTFAGSMLLAIQFLWSLSLANALSGPAVRYVVRAFLAITCITSVVAIWYYFGRNPTLRAKFPFGNPTFLASALIPGITLGCAWIAHLIFKGPRSELRKPTSSVLFWTLAALGAVVFGLWAFRLADSRGALVGLGAAILALGFLSLRGRGRFILVSVAIIAAVAGAFYFLSSAENSLTGRGSSLRLRGYSWNYAIRLFLERPFTGHGQGGYAFLGDAFVARDILSDPLVFDGRVDHAHNEWLEVLADLGIVGLGIELSLLVLTLIGTLMALRTATGEHKWCMIGLAASLTGLCVAECFGVGLRVSEVPVAYYSILGLTWAAALRETSRLQHLCLSSRWKGWGFGTSSLLAGFAAMVLSQLDFRAARVSFDAQQALVSADVDKAIESVDQGVWRLSPQRALAGRFLAAECYVRWAERAIAQATERDQRARSIEPPDSRIVQLAHADIAAAEEAIRTGGHILKELIERSPGYLNSGLLDSRIQLVRAQAALIRGDHDTANASRKGAVAGLERELERQPFRSGLATLFARFALPEVALSRVLTVVARPLRYEPITEEAASSLQSLAQNPETLVILNRTIDAIGANSVPVAPAPDIIELTWAPEVLRMSAALDHLHGEYSIAAKKLLGSAKLYSALERPATLGEAAAHLECAEALFFADPTATENPLLEAQVAFDSAPHSRLGREFQDMVRERMIQYYLAADQESKALSLLRASAPPGAAEEAIQLELGIRLQRLCAAILLQRREALVLRKPADVLAPYLERWLARAIDLNPEDVSSRFLAADLALHNGREKEATERLRDALRAGLNPDEVLRFLQVARERYPESQDLKSLEKELLDARSLASENKRP